MMNRKSIETPIDRAWAKNEKKNNNRRTDTVFRKAHALYGRFQSDCRIFVYVETMGTKRAYLSHDDDDFPFDMAEFRVRIKAKIPFMKIANLEAANVQEHRGP